MKIKKIEKNNKVLISFNIYYLKKPNGPMGSTTMGSDGLGYTSVLSLDKLSLIMWLWVLDPYPNSCDKSKYPDVQNCKKKKELKC